MGSKKGGAKKASSSAPSTSQRGGHGHAKGPAEESAPSAPVRRSTRTPVPSIRNPGAVIPSSQSREKALGDSATRGTGLKADEEPYLTESDDLKAAATTPPRGKRKRRVQETPSPLREEGRFQSPSQADPSPQHETEAQEPGKTSEVAGHSSASKESDKPGSISETESVDKKGVSGHTHKDSGVAPQPPVVTPAASEVEAAEAPSQGSSHRPPPHGEDLVPMAGATNFLEGKAAAVL